MNWSLIIDKDCILSFKKTQIILHYVEQKLLSSNEQKWSYNAPLGIPHFMEHEKNTLVQKDKKIY